MGGTGEIKLSLVGVLWSDAIVVDAYLDPVQSAHDKLIVAWATPLMANSAVKNIDLLQR